jgi:hypothetical protein
MSHILFTFRYAGCLLQKKRKGYNLWKKFMNKIPQWFIMLA